MTHSMINASREREREIPEFGGCNVVMHPAMTQVGILQNVSGLFEHVDSLLLLSLRFPLDMRGAASVGCGQGPSI